jgi:hypothetical protein
MSGTILYAAETTHQDRLLHVMGYQNRAENLGSGPNAMLLPIPSALPMGPENAVDMTTAKTVLRDYEKAYLANQRRNRGFSKSLGMDQDDLDEVQVFDSGSYTVVLAKDAKYINTALGQVPEHKRPKPNPMIFDAYSKLYPGWHIALCCYNGSVDAEPMVWKYEPLDPSHLWLPALDGHDGNIPNLNATVQRDHTVIVSMVNSPKTKFASEAKFRDTLPVTHQYLFGSSFHGIQTHGRTKNGDVMIPIKDIHGPFYLDGDNFKIALPPGA